MTDLAVASLAWVTSPDYVDLTARQMALLGILCDVGPQEVAKLSEILGIGKPVVTRAHTSLASHDLVVRRTHADDRRRCFLEATDHGREIRRAMIAPELGSAA